MSGSQMWWTAGFLFTPALIMAGAVAVWRWRLAQRQERVPVSEKLLRPAGESLRLRIDKLEERLSDAFFVVVIAPLAGAALVLVPPISGFVLARLGVAALVAAALYLAAGRFLFSILRELRNCNLGFHGERAVGEEINQLMRDGCRVFHDLPMEPYGNIDHVIVAPSGVYAVETKTRRKRKAPPGKKDHEVIFDGKTLEYPHCQDAHGLEQARQQADRLRVMLTKAVGEPVKVLPILTLPGWFVTTRVNDGMKVVNPKQIRQVVLNGKGPMLTPPLMERISHQLDQRCRDVEL